MKVALPIWLGRISPVFDAANRVLLVEVEDNQVRWRFEHDLAGPDRARDLVRLGVDLLICGAVSQQLAARLSTAGIELVSDTCGPVEAVLRAFLDGTLDDPAFAMPGCQSRRQRRLRHLRGIGKRSR